MKIRFAYVLLMLVGTAESAVGQSAPDRYLFVWAGSPASDFLAVIDTEPTSPDFARVITTLPVGQGGTRPHHTDHQLAPDRQLWANGFAAGRTFRFDLSKPRTPRLLGHFDMAGEYMHPHSFAAIPGGNRLATYQMRGHGNARPGALAELHSDGTVVQTGNSESGSAFIRPYSLAVVSYAGRVVTTSADMHGKEPSNFVQIWRKRDLKLLQTVSLPQGPRGKEGTDPAEPRLLSDGATVMVNSFNCGLFLLSDLRKTSVKARLVHDFGGGSQNCALPVVAGRYWVQTNANLPGLIALDVSDPERPREVSRLTLAPDMLVHWIALAPDGRRIVLSGGGGAMKQKVLMARIDPATGTLSLDRDFRAKGATSEGVSFSGSDWPHGATGPAVPHGAVFSR